MYIRQIQAPEWAINKFIYEINVRQYTKEGTLKALSPHLIGLKKMGVDIIWLMPIHPIGIMNRKGVLGSYYSISNYHEINPEFGNLKDFKDLVSEIHQLGMKVIIDWVANHTSWDHHWTITHPEFYKKDQKGNFIPPVEDWEDVIQLDYGQQSLWNSMVNEMKFWITETHIDGFRCDMAHLVPTPFWEFARKSLSTVKDIYMLAESENHDLLVQAFDTIYNWKLLHAMNHLASHNISAKELQIIILNELKYLPKGATFLHFTSNHDENSWQGSALSRLGKLLPLFTVLTFLLPGQPMIYGGQEAGLNKRLNFFEKDFIAWKENPMVPLIIKLHDIRKSWEPDTLVPLPLGDDPSDILALTDLSGNYVLLLNFSENKNYSFNPGCIHNPQQMMNLFSGKPIQSTKKSISIKPLNYKAFKRIP